MKLALSLYTTQYKVLELGGKSSPAAILNRAAVSTLPIGLDDIKSAAAMEEIAVHFYNGACHTTVSSGQTVPHTSLIVTANDSFCGTER